MRLVSYCRRFLKNIEDAEDAAQDVVVRVWKYRGTFTEGRPFLPWLLGVARNVCRSRLEAAIRRETVSLNALPEPAAPSGSMERQVLLGIDLKAALSILDPLDRSLIYQRLVLDVSWAAIANALGMNESTLKSRYRRALEKLEAFLGPPGGTSGPID